MRRGRNSGDRVTAPNGLVLTFVVVVGVAMTGGPTAAATPSASDDSTSTSLSSAAAAPRWVVATTQLPRANRHKYYGLVAGPAGTAAVLGQYGVIVRTTDRGRTWTRTAEPSADNVFGASFYSVNGGYVLTTNGELHRTADGGTTWEYIRTRETKHSQGLLALDRRTVYVVGRTKTRLSRDAGRTWTTVEALAASRTGGINSIERVRGTLFVWGSRSLWRSTDDGRSWARVLVPPVGTGCRPGNTCAGVPSLPGDMTDSDYLWEVDMVAPRRGWVALRDGQPYRTTDGGRTWRRSAAVGSRRVWDMAFPSGAEGFVVTGNGRLMHTEDAGRTWTRQSVPGRPDLVAAIGDGTAYLLTRQRVVYRTSTGR